MMIACNRSAYESLSQLCGSYGGPTLELVAVLAGRCFP